MNSSSVSDLLSCTSLREGMTPMGLLPESLLSPTPSCLHGHAVSPPEALP